MSVHFNRYDYSEDDALGSGVVSLRRRFSLDFFSSIFHDVYIHAHPLAKRIHLY